MAANGQRDPERERFWRTTLSAWRTSGESVRAFCTRRGLTETAFYFGRKELRRRDGERTARPATRTFEFPKVVGSAAGVEIAATDLALILGGVALNATRRVRLTRPSARS